MAEVLLFTQETWGRVQHSESIEDAYPDVEFREVDIQTGLEAAIERASQQSTGLAQRLTNIVRG